MASGCLRHASRIARMPTDTSLPADRSWMNLFAMCLTRSIATWGWRAKVQGCGFMAMKRRTRWALMGMYSGTGNWASSFTSEPLNQHGAFGDVNNRQNKKCASKYRDAELEGLGQSYLWGRQIVKGLRSKCHDLVNFLLARRNVPLEQLNRVEENQLVLPHEPKHSRGS